MDGYQPEIARQIREKRQTLAEQIVEKQYGLQPEFWNRFGPEGRKISIRDAAYHLQFLSEAILVADLSLFVDYIMWVREVFAGLHFPDDAIRVTLECARDGLRECFSSETTVITDAYIEAGLQTLQQDLVTTPEFLPEDAPLSDLAMRYMKTLLMGERHTASHLILGAVDKGVPIKDIYLHVFQRSQYEIGRLWMTNAISVAQEHYCTAATQLIMSQLYPHIFATERIGRRLVATCVGGELHEIGVRMVADFFEMDGWDTYYLGANTPTATILQAIADRLPNVLGISATMTFHINLVEDLIPRVRESEQGAQLKILVGGYPFTKSPELWKTVGADGYAPNALQAIELANALLVPPHDRS